MDDTKKDIKVGKIIGIETENSRVFGLLGACCTFLNKDENYDKTVDFVDIPSAQQYRESLKIKEKMRNFDI